MLHVANVYCAITRLHRQSTKHKLYYVKADFSFNIEGYAANYCLCFHLYAKLREDQDTSGLIVQDMLMSIIEKMQNYLLLSQTLNIFKNM